MRKTFLKTLRVFLFLLLFSAIGFGLFAISGGLKYASGRVPRVITAINVPLDITYRQEGNLSKDFAGMAAMNFHIPKETASLSGTIFEASLRIAGEKYFPKNSNEGRIVGNKIFRINVNDSTENNDLTFDNQMDLTLDLPEIIGNNSTLGIYSFNETAERWELIFNTYIDRAVGKAYFSTFSLSDFAFIEGDGRRYIDTRGDNGGDGILVKGINYLADGALIRGSNWRIYVINRGTKRYIKTLNELSRYTGQVIFNVDDTILNQYPTTYVMGAQGYGDGALLRGSDWRIYVIENGYKRQLRTLWDLAHYAGQRINNVDDYTLAQY